MSNTLQSILESGQEVRIVRIDFSAAFDMADHNGILHKLSSVSIGGFLLSTSTQLESNRPQHVMVDSCRSKLVTSCQESRKGVFVPIIAPHLHLKAFFHSEE